MSFGQIPVSPITGTVKLMAGAEQSVRFTQVSLLKADFHWRLIRSWNLKGVILKRVPFTE